ncbi:hypothetical protein PAPYR_7069 [Paratrimastix pyriformis]|uniref:Uncharacterized protein n=1 Tax=Paratrimastix pyriformis TaxID=342808 RepID=A0ABQ8UJ61_9EUKA|nr:hypothetical protein PAPYR_7069 [Paratrimastix pyriformis]
MTASIGIALDKGSYRQQPVAEFLRAQAAAAAAAPEGRQPGTDRLHQQPVAEYLRESAAAAAAAAAPEGGTDRLQQQPVAEFLREAAAAAAPEGRQPGTDRLQQQQPRDRLLSALVDYTTSPEFLDFLANNFCSAHTIITLAQNMGLLPLLHRILAPDRPIARHDCPEEDRGQLAKAIAIGALILEGGQCRACSPIMRSLVLWQLDSSGRNKLVPSSPASAPPPPLVKMLSDALRRCDVTMLRQAESRKKRYYDPDRPAWHCLRASAWHSCLYPALSKEARNCGCYCVPDTLLPPDAPGRPAAAAAGSRLKRTEFLIRHGEATHLIEFAVAPLGAQREAYFERLMNDRRFNSPFLSTALLVFFEPEPAIPKPPDLTPPNEAARQAIAAGQLQFLVVRFDEGLTRFTVYDPTKPDPEIVSARRPPMPPPSALTKASLPRLVGNRPSKVQLLAVLSKVQQQSPELADPHEWDPIRRTILGYCACVEDLQELDEPILCSEGLPGPVAHRVIQAISAALSGERDVTSTK